MTTVTIKALRGVVIGCDRSLQAGEVATVAALIAAELVAQQAAVLVHESDRPKLHDAVVDHIRRQTSGRLAPAQGDPWRPLH